VGRVLGEWGWGVDVYVGVSVGVSVGVWGWGVDGYRGCYDPVFTKLPFMKLSYI